MTTEAKHTEGPWITRTGTTTGKEVVGKTPRGKDYIVARCGGKDRQANANLIAAAPDLLAALESLTANLDEGDFISLTRIDTAKAAIAKARGA